MRRVIFLILIIGIAISGNAGAQNDLSWPVWPDSTRHILSALYGVWVINPGYPPFMHSGLDIDAAAETPVYAIESGWVKTITTRGGSYSSWRVVIGDSPGTDTCDAWMYAHVHEMSIPWNVMVGDYVEAGTYIGDVVDWPGMPTVIEHLHFSKIRYAGTAQQWEDGQDDWIFIANPLDYVTIDEDGDIPVLENAREGHLLAFCQNQSDIYFDPGAPVSGDVDIICRAYDYHNFYGWKQVPYIVEYKIEGASSVPWTVAACFTGVTGTYDQMADYTYIVYQDDETCNTTFNAATEQIYYFNLTNSDGDTLVEPSDKALCWETINFPNGDYWVHIRARDKTGNEVLDSMMVEVANIFQISGTVSLEGDNPYWQWTDVSIPPDFETNTEPGGTYLFDAVPSGTHTIIFSRSIYQTIDTLIDLIQDTVISVTLEIGNHFCGDSNNDGTINVGDAVWTIQYVFGSGPPPDPPRLGDANCDGQTNVGDAVYVIAYVFTSGQPPCEECLQ
jgi:hypothetical protein